MLTLLFTVILTYVKKLFSLFLSSFSQFLIPLVVFTEVLMSCFLPQSHKFPVTPQQNFQCCSPFYHIFPFMCIAVKVIHTFAGSISRLQCEAGRKQNSTGEDKAMLSTDYGRDTIMREWDTIFKVLKNWLWRCV